MTAARPSTAPAGAVPPSGAHRPGGRRQGMLIGALLVAVLLLAALLLGRCGSDDPGADDAARTSSDPTGSSPSAPSSTSGSAATSSAAGTDSDGLGQIMTADGQSVLDLAARPAALAGLSGAAATGTAVRVLSVPADEGFWVGNSDEQRLWVQLIGPPGESPYEVSQGDTVDFEGTVVPHDETFAGEVGLEEAEGASLLTAQGTHLEVAKSAVTLSE